MYATAVPSQVRFTKHFPLAADGGASPRKDKEARQLNIAKGNTLLGHENVPESEHKRSRALVIRQIDNSSEGTPPRTTDDDHIDEQPRAQQTFAMIFLDRNTKQCW
jgi:hypothetical protein